MAEELSIEKQLENVTEKVKSFATESMAAKAKEVFEAEKKALTDQVEALKTKVGENETKSATEKTELETKLAKLNKDIEDLGVKFAKSEMFGGGGSGRKKSFTEAIGDVMKENEGQFKTIARSSQGTTNLSISIKAATDENLDMSNFAGDTYEQLTTERRGLYQAPFAPLWLRNLLPNASTTRDVIFYPRFTGVTGKAGVWDGKPDIPNLVAKPGVKPNFDSVTENVKTIAGITRFKREMADDLPWLVPFIGQQLTTGEGGLFVAENEQIITTLDANSSAYEGEAGDIVLEQIYQAIIAQLPGHYLSANLVLMNSWDLAREVALNKASSSGLYNLPVGVVVTVGGFTTIAGVPVVGLPDAVVPKGVSYVLDRNQTQFVSRMQPELRFFEQDRDNVELNLITARAEERIATLVFNTKAIVKIGEATT